MSQEQPESLHESANNNSYDVTNARKQRNKQKNKARREKRKQAKSMNEDNSTQNETSNKPIQQNSFNQLKSCTDSKMENFKDATTNRKKTVPKRRKRSAKKQTPKVPERVSYKLTVRRLPPNLKEESFWEVVNTNFPDFNTLIHSHYYVNGYLPQTQFENPVFSRCYIDCIDEQSMMIVGKGIKTLTFTNDIEGQAKSDETGNSEVFDEKMEVYIPSIEKSFYQKMPQGGVQTFPENGSILNNIHYKLFTELLKEEGRMEMPKDIFDYALKLKEKQKREKKREKRAKRMKAKILKLEGSKKEKVNKPEEKVANTASNKPKKARKRKSKKKTTPTDHDQQSSTSRESNSIKFSLKKKPVAK